MKSWFDDLRRKLSTPRFFAGGYLAWVAAAEVITVFTSAQVGLWMHIGLLIALLYHGTRDLSRPLSRAWLCLGFAPMIRVVSLATPLSSFRLVHWYLLTGVPILVAAIVLMHVLGIPRERFALQIRWSSGQLLVAGSGVALGYLEYLIFRPQPLVSEVSLTAVLESVLILIVFTGLVEEIIFRGLMQHAISWILGKTGIVYVALVFAIMHLGYRSAADFLFVFVVAIYFGFFVQRTGSIFGVTLAHGLTNVSLFLIFPFLLSKPTPGELDLQTGVLSPPLPRTTPTPTPFLPQTPTPFLPLSPTPRPSLTPTPPAEGEETAPDADWIDASGMIADSVPFFCVQQRIQYAGAAPAYTSTCRAGFASAGRAALPGQTIDLFAVGIEQRPSLQFLKLPIRAFTGGV